MLKDFLDNDQSNTDIVRFFKVSYVYCWIDNLYQVFELLLKKNNFRRFHSENKKTDLEVLSKSFAFI